MNHPHLTNATDHNELEQRFDDDGYARTPADPVDRAPADPGRQVDVSRTTCCSPAEWEAIYEQTFRDITARLASWRETEALERRQEAVLKAAISAGYQSVKLKGLNQTR